MDNTKKIISIIIGVILLILIALGIYSIIKKSSISSEEGGGTSSIKTEPGSSENSLTVDDQYPGNIVYISSVSFKNGGFVVVHADDNGKPGKIIGSQYFAAGTNPGNIDLTEVSLEGKSYHVMLHGDDGDKIFDVTKDLPLVDTQGNIIVKKIKATTVFVEQKG